MPIPNVYRKSSEPSIASYSYTDIAEGTGVVKFYLFNSEDDSAKDYHLTSNVLFSRDVTAQASGSGSPKQDIDFDLAAFNMPQTINGTGYATIAMGGRSTAGSSVYIIVRVRKESGGETTLVSIQSDTHTLPAASTQNWYFNVPLVIPQTHFKKGDILRITIETYPVHVDTGIHIGTSPKNRGYTVAGGTAVTLSESTVYIPFKLDL